MYSGDESTEFAENHLSAEQSRWLRDYGRLDELVGRLMQAAIDAHMVENGWRMPTSVVPADDIPSDNNVREGIFENWYWRKDSRHEWSCVERPAEDGIGGGDGVVNTQFSFATMSRSSEFGDVRAAICRHVEKFYHLPEPRGVEGAAEAANLFKGIADGLDPAYGTLTSYIDAIKTDSAVLEGTAATTYKTSFLHCLGSVLDGYSALAALLSQYMAAQAGMWAAARADVVGTVVKATEAYDALARRVPPPADGWGTVVRVGRVTLEVASVFIPAGGAAKAASLGLMLLNSVTDEETKVEEPDTTTYSIYNKIYKAGLSAVNTQIEDVEHRIYSGSGATVDGISSADPVVRRNWQLPVKVADLSDEPGIAWDRGKVSNICHLHMPEIVARVSEMVNTARGLDDDIVGAVLRNDAVGRGHYGPALAVQELNDVFCDLLHQFGNLVARAGENLWAAYELACGADDAAAAASATTAAELLALETPNGYQDPWRYDSTPAPTPDDQQAYRDWVASKPLEF